VAAFFHDPGFDAFNEVFSQMARGDICDCSSPLQDSQFQVKTTEDSYRIEGRLHGVRNHNQISIQYEHPGHLTVGAVRRPVAECQFMCGSHHDQLHKVVKLPAGIRAKDISWSLDRNSYLVIHIQRPTTTHTQPPSASFPEEQSQSDHGFHSSEEFQNSEFHHSPLPPVSEEENTSEEQPNKNNEPTNSNFPQHDQYPYSRDLHRGDTKEEQADSNFLEISEDIDHDVHVEKHADAVDGFTTLRGDFQPY
jgi:HSP20 family molecular chaperone IbpA